MTLAEKVAGLFSGNEDPSNQPPEEDPSPDAGLFECEACDTTFISEGLEECPSCGDPVQDVPSERDLGML